MFSSPAVLQSGMADLCWHGVTPQESELVDVVFDKSFVGGSAMGGLVPNGTGAQIKAALLINRCVRMHARTRARRA